MGEFNHGYEHESQVTPNDEPERGRVKVVSTCGCGHEAAGFGNTRMSAWTRALRSTFDHIGQALNETQREVEEPRQWRP